MVNEAEEFAEQDKKVKARIDARNQLETYAYNMKQVGGWGFAGRGCAVQGAGMGGWVCLVFGVPVGAGAAGCVGGWSGCSGGRRGGALGW